MSEEPRRFPSATYRLQFNSQFRFADAKAIVPYLHALGITHCYASPLFSAGPDSTHGYDICDFTQLNPSLGTRKEFEAFVHALHEHGMGLILDMVPNHMAADPSNPWWQDVLRWGPKSKSANWFDIEWQPATSDIRDKVLLPILEDHLGSVLEAGKLKLQFESGQFILHYYSKAFPIAPASYPSILNALIECLPKHHADASLESGIRDCFGRLKGALAHETSAEPEAAAKRHAEAFDTLRTKLLEFHRSSKVFRLVVDDTLLEFNGTASRPASFDRLFQLLQEQHYRLAFWRVGSEEINYRRFFDVTGLVSLRMELPEVFQAAHSLVLELLEKRQVDGLRIDHPDGLYDPKAYFGRLQESYARVCGAKVGPASSERPLYVVVEKILTDDEPLPEDWAVHGTTGYEFLNLLNGLFVDSRHEAQLAHIYKDFTGQNKSFSSIVYGAKKRILEKSLISEVTALTHRLKKVAVQARVSQDFTFSQLRRALSEVIEVFPVYRTYITEQTRPVTPHEQQWIDQACQKARDHSPLGDHPAIEFLHDLLALNFPRDLTEKGRREAREFVLKFQQLTGPAMAKGLEDTSFYRYFRLCSLNEVGGNPAHFGTSVPTFHRANQHRLEKWPQNLLATATHDTKRGEDVRARINVLSEIPSEWQKAVHRWRAFNAPLKTVPGSKPAPEANDEYLLYQTLIGAWPCSQSGPAWETFRQRIGAYMIKAVKEAKQNTSWTEPNPAYEEAVQKFVEAVLQPSNSKFIDDFSEFHSQVALFGQLNSLSQLVLKIGSPGVPDFYQGTELWDLTLVDPDNRRPVNYDERRRLLTQLKDHKSDQVLVDDGVGRTKLAITRTALKFRKDHADLFQTGEYLPVDVQGRHHEHVCAFARKQASELALIVAPRLCCTLLRRERRLPMGEIWEDTRLVLPISEKHQFQNVFTGEVVSAEESENSLILRISEVLASLPVAILG